MINDFHGKYFFLSNFYAYPFFYHGREWRTVEHAFQAEKCVHKTEYDAIHQALTPNEAKRLGRRCTLIDGWDSKRITVMRECLLMKFLANDELLQKLLDTGDEELVEGNTWHDNDWGDCSCPKCANKPGQNMLGKMLMAIRENAREGNYIWVARNLQTNEIIMHFKNKDTAFKWLNGLYVEDAADHYQGYGLDVVTLV